ncbi:MAG: YeeE/YedE thiosulfate transporter family protein [Candidatus Neomarinimicrobiota bacterium]
MMAPFYKFGLFGPGISLLAAFVIGLGFGFFLERGGLGNARKLAGQFYLTDLTVFKVMFTAILTAMLGLYWLAWLGLLDLSQVYLNPTYLMPQLVAGLLFGVGFVTGGLCPGTCLVATATGKVDGLVALIGIFFGIFVFGELFDGISGFFYSTAYGQFTLPQLLHISPGLMILLVVLLALAGFAGAEAIERKTPIKQGLQAMRTLATRLSFRQRLALVAVVPALLAAVTGYSDRTLAGVEQVDKMMIAGERVDLLAAPQLAEWIMEQEDDLLVLDLRPAEEFAEYHLPFALNAPDGESPELSPSPQGKVVLYTLDGTVSDEAWVAIKAGDWQDVQVLRGGLEAWAAEILFPDLTDTRSMNLRQLEKRARMSRYFGGEPQLPPELENPPLNEFLREGC